MNLSFQSLRDANIARVTDYESMPGGIDTWNPLEWAGALGGEAGELLNKCKKLRRGEDVPLEAIAEEIADVVIYADLVAARFRLDLAAEVAKKFNVVSERIGSKVRL